MSANKIQRITDLIGQVRAFRFCGPSDDPDEQTAVCVGYRHLIIQLQRLAVRVLPQTERERLESIDVEIDNTYSVYEANAELETLLSEIEDALAGVDTGQLNMMLQGSSIHPSLKNSMLSSRHNSILHSSSGSAKKSIPVGAWNVVATALTMRAVLNYIRPFSDIQHSNNSLPKRSVREINVYALAGRAPENR